MILLDTHVLLWAVGDDARLGDHARSLLDAAYQADETRISAITAWEFALLCQKGRLSVDGDPLSWIESALSRAGVRLVPLPPAIAVESVSLPGNLRANLADRIIVATAQSLDAPLLTADKAILDYADNGRLEAIDARC